MRSILATLLMLALPLSASTTHSLTKKRVLADLDCIQSMFEVKYAPKAWKQQFAGWDLTQAIQEAKSKIESHPALTLKESQIIIRDFFNSARDYHVAVAFDSTEYASLPFLVRGTQGRYFIVYINKDYRAKAKFPFEEGDEILTFDGRPVHDVIEELRIRDYGNNTYETDQAFAELSLTRRDGSKGQLVPSGNVEITGIKKRRAKPTTIVMAWDYQPEKIRDFSKLGTNIDLQTLTQLEDEALDFRSLIKKSQFFEKSMAAAFWDQSDSSGVKEKYKHFVGESTHSIPELDTIIWKSKANANFKAFIFETDSGKKIGFIRLPHYHGGEKEVEEFGSTMNYFQRMTDALIIDQANNPGGYVLYLYALASTLTDEPLFTPRHHISLAQTDVIWANFLLPKLESVNSDESACALLGDSVMGYPVDYSFAQLEQKFCRFLISQWEEGKLFSDPTYLFGVDEIRPHPKYRYTKPILLLVNSLSFSAADFFPAIMQDNKRATIFGTRTAGAGGYVLTAGYPNHSGINHLRMTESFAERIDNKPIENLGVTPDIQYEVSVVDFQEDYREYTAAIIAAAEALTKKLYP